MGARIIMSMADFLANEGVEISIASTLLDGGGETPDSVESYAIVKYRNTSVAKDDPSAYCTWALYAQADQGGSISLESDFDFFRETERHAEHMRMLFENSIPFQVIP